MRIVCICFCPPFGAIADNFREIVSGLSQFCEVIAVCPESLELKSTHTLSVIALKYTRVVPSFFFEDANRKIFLQLRQTEAEVVLIFSTHLFNQFAQIALRHIPQIAWWHEPPSLSRLPVARFIWNLVCDFLTHKTARGLVFASSAFIENLPRRFQDPSRYRIVRLPMLTPMSRRTSRCLQGESRLASKTDFVFFGKLERYKGLDLLAEAILLLLAKGINPRVRVIGAGNYANDAPKLLLAAALHPHSITIEPNFLPPEEVVEAVVDSGCVVLPYVSVTATNVVPVAWALGKPVIVPRISYFTEIVQDQVNGYFFDVADATSLAAVMASFLTIDRKGRDYLDASEAALERSRDFSPKEICEQLYQACCALRLNVA